MKTCLFTFLALICSIAVNAQNDNFKKGQSDLQFGLGLLSTLNQDLKGIDGTKAKLTVPPVSVSVDYALTDEWSVGGTIAYAKTHLDYQGSSLVDVSNFIVGIRGLYHLFIISSLDTYGGAMLGYNIAKVSDQSSNIKVNGLAYTLLVGGRYRLSKNTGLFLELGYGIASVNFGLNIKF